MRTLSTIELASAADAGRAVAHLNRALSGYDCAAWSNGATVKVLLELQGESSAQRMAAWRRIVAVGLSVLGIEVVGYG